MGKLSDYKISGCLIVKNEEEFLGAALSSLKDVCDEIVVVDTGSTDRSLEVASEFTGQVFKYEWKDDFADVER